MVARASKRTLFMANYLRLQCWKKIPTRPRETCLFVVCQVSFLFSKIPCPEWEPGPIFTMKIHAQHWQHMHGEKYVKYLEQKLCSGRQFARWRFATEANNFYRRNECSKRRLDTHGGTRGGGRLNGNLKGTERVKVLSSNARRFKCIRQKKNFTRWSVFQKPKLVWTPVNWNENCSSLSSWPRTSRGPTRSAFLGRRLLVIHAIKRPAAKGHATHQNENAYVLWGHY